MSDETSRIWKQIHEINRQLRNLRDPQAYAPDRTVFASYSTNAGQSISNNASPQEIIDFEDKTADTHSAVTVGASWKFTAPVRLVYTVRAHILYTSTTTWALAEIGSLSLFKNGARFRALDRNDNMDSSAGALYKRLHGSCSLLLEPGDYISIRTYQTSGAALALHNDGEFCWVTITGRRGI